MKANVFYERPRSIYKEKNKCPVKGEDAMEKGLVRMMKALKAAQEKKKLEPLKAAAIKQGFHFTYKKLQDKVIGPVNLNCAIQLTLISEKNKCEKFDWSSINVNGGTDKQKVSDLAKDLHKFEASSPHRKSCGLGKVAQWLRANGEPSVRRNVVKVPPEIAHKLVKT